MMKVKYWYFILFLPQFVCAYKTPVHGLMSYLAADRSVVTHPSIWRQFGYSEVPEVLRAVEYKVEDEIYWKKYIDDNKRLRPLKYKLRTLFAIGADIEDTGVAFVDENGDDRNVFLSRAVNQFDNPKTVKWIILILRIIHRIHQVLLKLCRQWRANQFLLFRLVCDGSSDLKRDFPNFI